MKKGKKCLVILLLALLVFNLPGLIVPHASAEPSAMSVELSLPADLTDWIMDEEAGYIYAVSSAENNLYFIRLSDFKIEKTLNVGSRPSYLAKDGQFLQIALSGATMIKTVDLSTKQVSGTIITSGIPSSVAASSKYLYYDTADGIYKYDKVSGAATMLTREFSNDAAALAIDEATSILYAGRISSYGGLTALDAESGAILSNDADDDMEIGGPSLALKHIFIDEQSVYFGGHQFNKYNVLEATGSYPRSANDYGYLESVILDITDSYVVTIQGVYDKHTYTQLLPFANNPKFALLDSKGRAYLVGTANSYYEDKKISRLEITIPSPQTALFTTDAHSLKSDYAITDWITNDSSAYIYTILADTNELAVISKADLNVVKKMFIGSQPRQIKLFNNKLYVIFEGENHINVLKLSDGLPDGDITKVTTRQYPLDVFPDYNDRIIYRGNSFGSGISVTSAVYTSVSDAVYEKETDISSTYNSFAFDPDHEILYRAGFYDFEKYDSNTFELIEKSNLSGSNYPLLIDGDSLYYANSRYDLNQPSVIYGSYGEQIIYAREGLVFSRTSVYDRDSTSKKYDLIMNINKAYVGNDQTIFLSTDKRLYKYDSLEEMQSNRSGSLMPSNGEFVDEDLTAGQIDGYLTFKPAANKDEITRYDIHFVDSSGKKLQWAWAYKDGDLSTDSLSVYEVSHATIPPGAVGLGVFPVLKGDGLFISERVLDMYLLVPFYDAPGYLPSDIVLTDSNPAIDVFNGTVKWTAGAVELPGVRYSLYFIDEEGPLGDALAVVSGGQKNYSLAIDIAVPDEALGIGVFTKNDNFVSPFYSKGVFPEKVTPDIAASSISVYKYWIQSDKVVVNNLMPGDIIRVYDEKQHRYYGYGIVAPKSSTITISVGDIGNPGDKILITRQTVNRIESMGTLVTVPAIIDDRTGTVPGNGSGPGNVGGPGNVSGPGNVGSTGGTGAAPAGDAKLVTTMQENTDGTRSSLTEISSAYISKILTDAEFKKNPVITVKADETAVTQRAQFRIDSSVMDNINSNAKDAVLILESATGKLQLPVNSLSANVKRTEGTIVITIAQAANDYKVKLDNQLKGSSAVVLGNPIDYEVKLTGSGTDQILTAFSDYVSHVVSVKTAQDTNAVYSGLTYDPVTKAYVPVPTTWEWKDGVLQVTMKRKGNSVYAVVQNQVQFKDLSSSPYKDSILALANRNVINGYDDGSFKAEAVVTRAEFAAMLNRALGVLPKQQASKSFKDVQSGAWYAVQVNAAVDAGLINGFTDGTFRPNQEITHQEMVVMLVNALQYSGTSIKGKAAQAAYPANLPEWVKPYYILAQDSGILQTGSPFQFQTGKKTERQESAVLLYQLMKVLKLTSE